MMISRNTEKPGKKKKKNSARLFVTYMQEKLAVTVMVITLALFALILVLYDIIKVNEKDYTQIVLSQQEYDSRVIPYRRGDIVDRNGTFLATSEKVYNLILDPKQILWAKERYLEPTLTALSQVFGYDQGELRQLILDHGESAYIRYARQLSYDEKNAFESLQEETNKANQEAGSTERIRGVWFEDEYKRTYPYASLGCHVIGFSQSDGSTGIGGIEQYYNDQLTGVNGREYGYLNEETDLERVIKPPSNGNTVVSTIDVKIQQIVEQHIDEWEAATGSDMSAAIVMDPNNGEVLAMTDKDQFDLNDPKDLGGRYTNAELRRFGVQEAIDDYHRKNPDTPKLTETQVREYYTEDEILSLGTQVAWNKVWRNFCISDTYEPGSPQKIFTVAAALEEGVLTGSEHFECDGFQEINGEKVHCVKTTGHGWLDVTESLMQSCNDALMQIAAMIGKERFSKYQRMFGFGSKTGIDLPGEADTGTLVYEAEDMRPIDLATNSFGQNYNCTMIQMAAAYCSVINGGSYYEPHVVKQIVNEQGFVVEKVEPKLIRETVSATTAAFIRQALLRTVSEGTGAAAKVEGYKVGGKTGTAQKYPRKDKNYLVSFAGFAPADDPKVFVYVVIDVPHVEDQPHSVFASTIAKEILTDVLPYMNVFSDVELTDPSEEIESQLPQQEGISQGEGLTGEEPGTEETEAETKVYETDEYIEPTEGGEEGSEGESGEGAEGESPAGESRANGEERPEGESQTGGGEHPEGESRMGEGERPAGERQTGEGRAGGESAGMVRTRGMQIPT